MDKLSLLRTVFVFSGLEESLLLKISGMLREVKFGAGVEIFAQSRQADSFFIIDSGEVSIFKKLGPGHEKTLAVLGPGSVFGEMAFFSDSPRTAGAVSMTDTVLWKIDRGDFIKFVSDEPKAGLRVLSGLLQVAMDRLEQTSRELATIYHTGKIISSDKKLSDMLKNILDEVLLAIPEATDGAVYLFNEYNAEFDPAAAPRNAKEVSPGSPLIALLKQKTAGAIVDAPENISPLGEDIFKNAKSLLISPITKDSVILGFMLLWNSNASSAFRSSHLLLVSTVSSQLAEAIKNIRYRQDERDRQRLNNAKQSY